MSKKGIISVILFILFSLGYSIYVTLNPEEIGQGEEFKEGTSYGVPYPDPTKEISRYNFQKGEWDYKEPKETIVKKTIDPNYEHPYYKEQDRRKSFEQEIEDYIRDNEDEIREILEDNN